MRRRRSFRPHWRMSILDAELLGLLDGVANSGYNVNDWRWVPLHKYVAYTRARIEGLQQQEIEYDYFQRRTAVFEVLDEWYWVAFPDRSVRAPAKLIAEALTVFPELDELTATEIEPHVLAWRRERTPA